MNLRVRKSLLLLLALIIGLFVTARCGRDNGTDAHDDARATSAASMPANLAATTATNPPDEGDSLRREFVAIPRPLAVKYEDYTIPARGGKMNLPPRPASRIAVRDDLRDFIGRHDERDLLVQVVSPLLDDPTFSGDACILYCSITGSEASDWLARSLHDSRYQSPGKPGQWGRPPYTSTVSLIKEFTSFELRNSPATHPSPPAAPQPSPPAATQPATGAAIMAPPMRVSRTFLDKVDRRLAILQAHPEYFKLLDQPSAFDSPKKRDDIGEHGLNWSRGVLPHFLATASNGSPRVLAVNGTDTRVFFTAESAGYQAVGWTGIGTPLQVEHLALLVEPKPDTAGRLPDPWAKSLPVDADPEMQRLVSRDGGELLPIGAAAGLLRVVTTTHGPLVTNLAEPEATAAALARLLKDSIGLTCDQIVILTFDDRVLYCRALTPDADKFVTFRHDVQIWVAQGGFFLKAKLEAEGGQYYAKPSVVRRNLKDLPWPEPLPPGWPSK